MRIHWHVAEEDAAAVRLREWLAACLEERRRQGSPHQAVLSWGIASRGLTYCTPGRDETPATGNWLEVARQVRADLTVVLRPGPDGGGTLVLARGRAVPTEVAARWQWAPGEISRAGEQRVLYPRLPLSWPRRGAGAAERIILLVSLAERASVEAAYRLADTLQREFPELPVLLVSEPARFGTEPGGWAAPPIGSLAQNETVILCSGELAWAPVVLEALARGCRVIAPAGAAYAGYLAEERGQCWDPAGRGEDVATHLRSALQDPEEASRRTRRAAAWARRWTLARTAGDLEAWVLELARALPPPRKGSRREWVLRREIGIGDIIFALCSAAALKRRDPNCYLTFHTAPEHAEWVRWFPCVDAVTSGPFNPPPGAHVGDLERCFPSTAAVDRAVAMGQVVGVEACWPAPPQIPTNYRRAAIVRLSCVRRPRIAFAPASKARHMTRTLDRETTLQLAAQLQEQGTVIWLDAEPLEVPVPQGVVDLSGQLTVPEVLAVLAQCDACISVDSGLLYLAAALGKPVVGLFTHIGALQRLWLAPRFVALQPLLPCAPCGEGPEALHCRRGQPLNGTPLPCVQLPWGLHLPEALACALGNVPAPSRLVGNLAPGGTRSEWDVDALPAPWRLPVLG